MANAMVDPQERQPPPPPLSAPSAFLWSGLLLLALAALLGINYIIRAGSEGDNALNRGFGVAFLLFLSAVALLFAQARYPFWRKAAGIVELHPLAPVSHRMRDERETYLQRGEYLVLLAFLALAILPRVPALNHSLWYGELNALEFMRHGPSYALTHQSGFSNHLLDSLLGNLVLQAFGMAEGTTAPPAWIVRLPAFLFGVLAVPLLYLTVREALGRSVGAAAALLLAFSPAAVDLSTQARGYSAFLFFMIAQGYFLCRALRLTTASAWIGWLICAVLGVMAHLYFVFVIGANLVYLCARAIWRSAYLRTHPHAIALIEQAVVMTTAWIFCFCVVYSSVGPAMLAEAKLTSGTMPATHARAALLPLLQWWGGVPDGVWLNIFYGVCGILALCGLWYLAQRPSGGVLYIPLLLLAPPLIVEIAQPHYFYMRFFSFGLPPFLVLMACGMAHLAHWIIGGGERNEAKRNAALLCLAALFSLLCAPGLWQVIHLPKQDYQGAAVALATQAQSDAIAGIGTGAKLLQQYGVNIVTVEEEATWQALFRSGKPIILVDTDLTLNPPIQMPLHLRRIQKAAGRPERILPGRFSHWRHRWQDGDSDIKIYRVEAKALH